MNEEKIQNMFTELKQFMISNFEVINQRIEKLDKKIEEKFENLEKRIVILEQKVEELEKRVVIIESTLGKLKKDFEEHVNEQRLNLASLEHTLYERTGALFDAYDVNKNSDKKIKDEIKSLYNILEKHAYRLKKLESKIN